MSPAKAAQAAALFGLLGLSGCSLFGSSQPPQACPAAVILRTLTNTAVFGGSGEVRPENVAFYGKLSEVDRTCEYANGAVKMTLDVIVVGQRGPAARGDSVDLTYFVAATGPNQQVISKKPFTVRIGFKSDQIRAGVTDHIVETIALGGHKGSDVNVLLGFQQNPQVVEFYQHYRGR